MLDLTRVAAQINAVVERLRRGADERRAHLDRALELAAVQADDFERLKQKAARSRTTWLVAGLLEPPGGRFDAPPCPTDHVILATDGSQIDVDRHQSARCFLINIGRVRLDYGQRPDAVLDSVPRLYAGAEEMVISDGLREQPIEGALLGIKRGIEELKHLADMAEGLTPDTPALALVDGSLIIWGLSTKEYPDFVIQQLFDQGYLKSLDAIQKLARQRRLALASYISFPRSTDVINALRLALCPDAIADCDQRCKNLPCDKRPCQPVSGVQDRDIFGEMLDEGQRSALFYTQSKIVNERYGAHRVYFFYLKLDGEIARVEVPEWVALDKAKLELTHALVLNQCKRGQGYPAALAEAHEQAVVTGADRASFQQMLEMWLTEEGLPQSSSAKSRSKQTRWV